MTIGFIYTGSTYATPDKSMNKSTQPRVLTASFGDGYEQRIADGINSINETYSLSFKTRPKEVIDDIVAFLDTKKNVSKFVLTIPDTNDAHAQGNAEKDVKVVATNYSVTYDYENFYSLSLSLKRVYEA